MGIPLIYKILIALVYGAAIGVATTPLSKALILKRVEDPAEAAPLGNRIYRLLSVVVGIGISFAVVFTAASIPVMIRNLALLLPMFSIAVVDFLIRKIPNPLLIVMLVVQTAYLVYSCIAKKSTDMLVAAFIGLIIGFIVCWAPSLLRIPMGNGDIKYNAVIGFCVAAVGYFQSMIYMGVLVLIYLIYLWIKKGDLKAGLEELAAMGPFLSIATIITLCTPSILELIGINIAF